MTPEEKRIAIAEACGWRFAETGPRGKTWVPPQRQPIKYVTINGLPNYLNDLNAMHEAEKTLSHQEHRRFCDLLCGAMVGGTVDEAVSSTAVQRADAFIATLNLDKSSHEPS